MSDFGSEDSRSIRGGAANLDRYHHLSNQGDCDVLLTRIKSGSIPEGGGSNLNYTS